MLEFTIVDAKHAANESRQPFRDERGQGSIVFDPTQLRQVTPAFFDPASYGALAQPVQGKGGRGAAWYVRGAFGDGVLRQYRRGGLMARLLMDTYIWRGEKRARSFHEFELMQRLRELGLPVPMPIAGLYHRKAWRYTAAIIVERIGDARSFADIVDAEGALAPWAAVGKVIGRCHRQFAHHADLNAQNILIGRSNKIFLIDWDKGCIEAATGTWCPRVLERLQRSLKKECPNATPEIIDAGMKLLRQAHDRELAS